MDDSTILSRINELVEEEHKLRAQEQANHKTTDEERARLRSLEESLDQCWDLLRRRRAARTAGNDPETVGDRGKNEVESYLQ
ncbi:DUF2630 family protein [Micromonospora sp. NPDC050397]|uniref:DUF2630 family protein n=1 Tax=Micromonospora sp. NPDC050397 TaxID=3364279 RepID=UPI00384AE885